MGYVNWDCPCAPYSCNYRPCPGECSRCGEHLDIDEYERRVWCPDCDKEKIEEETDC